MKKYIMAAIAAVAIMPLFTSCSEDETVKMSTEDGAPIRFSATTKAAKDSRTSYSTEMKNGKWDLYWVSDDQVTIFCPEANTQGGNENVATYTVVSTNASAKKTKYELVGEGLHWGAKETHNFYEAYPSKNVSEITEDRIKATIPSTQYAKKQADNFYADMDAALMAGKIKCDKSEVEAKGLDIPFQPIFTAVDITVKRSTNQDFKIKSITVANIETEQNPAPLAGDFTYNYMGTYSSVSPETEKDNVQVEFIDANGDPEEIVLDKDFTELKVTVFLRGDFDKAVKVVLNAESYNKETETVTRGFFKKQGKAVDKLIPAARNHIDLDALPDAELKAMTGEWWVSHMSDYIYVSQMSLPGVYDAANFRDKITGDDRTQTEYSDSYNGQITTYLNAGNRVFDFKPTYDTYSGNWYTNRVPNFLRNPEAVNFQQVIDASVAWLQKHTTEFIVFILSDNEHTSTWDATRGYSSQDYYNHAHEIVDLIPERYLLKNFTSDVTIAQARGKILIINGTPCAQSVGLTVPEWRFNSKVSATSGAKSDSFFENDGVSYNFSTGGKIWVEDFNNGANHDASTLKKKEECIQGSIARAVQNTDESNIWHVTSLAFRHWSLGSDYTYSDGAVRFIPYATTIVQGLSSESYENCGIILQAYAGGTKSSGVNGKTLEDIIWANNYKANGPMKAQNK